MISKYFLVFITHKKPGNTKWFFNGRRLHKHARVKLLDHSVKLGVKNYIKGNLIWADRLGYIYSKRK